MKKITALIISLLLLLPAVMIPVWANPDFVGEVGEIDLKIASPEIDGKLSRGEGWGVPTHIDKTKYSTAWNSQYDYNWSCDLYVTYDYEGLYFAANINDNYDYHHGVGGVETVHDGTVVSDPDIPAEDDVRFNGDVFILALDPQNYFYNHGIDSTHEHVVWYNVSPLEDGVAIERTITNPGPITGADAAGGLTEEGWLFEAFIPWEEIALDCAARSKGEWTPTAADLCLPSTGELFEDGKANRYGDCTWTIANIIIVDRYYDEDKADYSTWQRYCTVATRVSWWSGAETEGTSNRCAGIYLCLTGEESKEYAFTDVGEDDWFYAPVYSAVDAGLFSGVSESEFAPLAPMTRSMFVSVLHRLAGSVEPLSTVSPFTDISENDYYYKAVLWASENGIVSGTEPGIFAPLIPITREQMVSLLLRYASTLGAVYDTSGVDSVFADADEISDWAYNTFAGAYNSGIISGSPGALGLYGRPKATASRAEAATMIVRFSAILPTLIPTPIPKAHVTIYGHTFPVTFESDEIAFSFSESLDFSCIMVESGLGSKTALGKFFPLSNQISGGKLSAGDIIVNSNGMLEIVYLDRNIALTERCSMIGHIDAPELTDLLGDGRCYLTFGLD